jgi:hypothetical protein
VDHQAVLVGANDAALGCDAIGEQHTQQAAGGVLGAELALGYFLAREFGGGPLVSALVGAATLGVAWETARRWERGRRRWGSGRH